MENTLYTERDFLKLLKDEKNIYLYGAGRIGKLLTRRLNKYDLHVCGYIETNKTADTLSGIPIMSINDIKKEKDLCIIVATANGWQKEILKKLEGYKNVWLLSDQLIRTMKMLDQKKLQFQTHVVEHCNLNCRGCYHFSPLAKEEYLSIEEYENDIARLSELFKREMERILLLGGEPLLHPQISDFFKITRKYFLNGKLQILTNGMLLLKMGEDFYRSIYEYDAELWVTKYPINFDYDKATRLAEAYGVNLNYFSSEPVRTLGHQPLDITGKQNGIDNFYHCYRANECIDLKHGKMYSCIIPAEIKPFCEYYNINIPVTEDDYVDIYKISSAEELLEKLTLPMPFCKYCNRKEVEVFGVSPWRRTEYRMEEWTD